jgi:hypothetical protein
MDELAEIQSDELEVVKLDYGNTGLCGSVASLLKVLTKTMEKQGKNINDIAIVQKSICDQMGILIPDNFLVAEINIGDSNDGIGSIRHFLASCLEPDENGRIMTSDLYLGLATSIVVSG